MIPRNREFLPDRAPEVLAHAVKHGYEGLVDEVVPHIARWPLTKTMEKLPLTRGLAWVRT